MTVPVTCSHCNGHEPSLLALRCICGKVDLVCPGCLRLMADAMEAGDELPVAHVHHPLPLYAAEPYQH